MKGVGMKKILVLIMIIMCLAFLGCEQTETVTVERYYVKKHEIHNTGIEIWCKSESGKEDVFFVEDKDIIPGELYSHATAVYHSYGDGRVGSLKEIKLYLEEEYYKEYIKEKYDLQ